MRSLKFGILIFLKLLRPKGLELLAEHSVAETNKQMMSFVFNVALRTLVYTIIGATFGNQEVRKVLCVMFFSTL
jgi:hypothetical protein